MAIFKKLIALGGLFIAGNSISQADTLTLDPTLCPGTWEIVGGTLRCNASSGGGGGGNTPGFFTINNTIVVSEGGTATATIGRTNGSQGSVSVEVSASQNTALAGIDFTLPTQNPTILNWNDADTSTRSFSVQTTNDTDTEPTETFFINLAHAEGGAQIQTSTSTVSITDNDGGGGGGGGGSCGSDGKIIKIPNQSRGISYSSGTMSSPRASEFAFEVDTTTLQEYTSASFGQHAANYAPKRLLTISESPCDFNITNKVKNTTYVSINEGGLTLNKSMMTARIYYFNLRTTDVNGVETCPVGKICSFIMNITGK